MLDLQSADILRSALESVQAGVFIVDRDRKICFWNEAAEGITGYLCRDVLGHFCGEILLVKFQEKKGAVCDHSCPLTEAMRDGKPRESHVYLHHRSGYPVPVSLRAVPLRGADGRMVGAVESFVERPYVSAHRRPCRESAAGRSLDSATQLPDYPHTESYLADRLKFASEHAIPFGLLCIQLDRMGDLTARHGLQAAEAILNVVAHTLRNGLDPADFVGRWSDDQFLAVTVTGGENELLGTAERLRRLAQSSEIAWWGDPLSVTVSIGGTSMRPGEALVGLLERLGKALQQASTAGGNSSAVIPAFETP